MARLEEAKVWRVQDLPVHLDGARLFNAAVALGVDVKAITDLVTSVQFCLSKVSAAPAASRKYVHSRNCSSAHNRRQDSRKVSAHVCQKGLLDISGKNMHQKRLLMSSSNAHWSECDQSSRAHSCQDS